MLYILRTCSDYAVPCLCDDMCLKGSNRLFSVKFGGLLGFGRIRVGQSQRKLLKLSHIVLRIFCQLQSFTLLQN